jgi:ferric-dicitrate binding protein FerR (iron transport regulator)
MDSTVRVYTPLAEVKIIGTVFKVYVYEKRTVVSVEKGTVAVTHLKRRESITLKGGAYVKVEVGEKISSHDGEYEETGE